MHKSIGDILRVRCNAYPPQMLGNAQAMVDEQLAVALHAVRTNVSWATGYSPGALAFHRDMFLDVPYVADLLKIREKRQLIVDKDLRRENARRFAFDYKVGEQVLKKRHEWSKLGERWDGPYEISRVHVNGNVTIKLRDEVLERLNIRRVKPYHEPTVRATDIETNPVVPTQPVSHRNRAWT